MHMQAFVCYWFCDGVYSLQSAITLSLLLFHDPADEVFTINLHLPVLRPILVVVSSNVV